MPGSAIQKAIASALQNTLGSSSIIDDDGIAREEAYHIAESVFNELDKGNYFGSNMSSDTRAEIIRAISEALGHVNEKPGDYKRGVWKECFPRPKLDDATQAIYKNLEKRGHLSSNLKL